MICCAANRGAARRVILNDVNDVHARSLRFPQAAEDLKKVVATKDVEAIQAKLEEVSEAEVQIQLGLQRDPL